MSGGNGMAPPAVATLSICNRTASGCSGSASYSLAAIRDLSVDVRWSHLTEGTHTQTVELLEPGGGSYQVQYSSFAIDNPGDGSVQANAVFPVAGSWITVRGITGNWSVRVSLDGQNVSTQPVDFQP